MVCLPLNFHLILFFLPFPYVHLMCPFSSSLREEARLAGHYSFLGLPLDLAGIWSGLGVPPIPHASGLRGPVCSLPLHPPPHLPVAPPAKEVRLPLPTGEMAPGAEPLPGYTTCCLFLHTSSLPLPCPPSLHLSPGLPDALPWRFLDLDS